MFDIDDEVLFVRKQRRE